MSIDSRFNNRDIVAQYKQLIMDNNRDTDEMLRLTNQFKVQAKELTEKIEDINSRVTARNQKMNAFFSMPTTTATNTAVIVPASASVASKSQEEKQYFVALADASVLRSAASKREEDKQYFDSHTGSLYD